MTPKESNFDLHAFKYLPVFFCFFLSKVFGKHFILMHLCLMAVLLGSDLLGCVTLHIILRNWKKVDRCSIGNRGWRFQALLSLQRVCRLSDPLPQTRVPERRRARGEDREGNYSIWTFWTVFTHKKSLIFLKFGLQRGLTQAAEWIAFCNLCS